jgi:hypothetical protein
VQKMPPLRAAAQRSGVAPAKRGNKALHSRHLLLPADKADSGQGGRGTLVGKIYNEHLVGYCRMSQDADDFEDDDFEEDEDDASDDEGDE